MLVNLHSGQWSIDECITMPAGYLWARHDGRCMSLQSLELKPREFFVLCDDRALTAIFDRSPATSTTRGAGVATERQVSGGTKKGNLVNVAVPLACKYLIDLVTTCK